MTGARDDSTDQPELTVVPGGHSGVIIPMGRNELELPISIMLRGSREVDLFREAMGTKTSAGSEMAQIDRVILALRVVACALVDAAADETPPEVVVDIDEHGDSKQGLISVFARKRPPGLPRRG
ncbi:hypothetical protein [Amycolatopsis sp. NBC_01480]|uniref:hypothetical protein n=1 Tax=Amycolatopsis sp. NBC_01480 TaxID=2903562 RepID=UPI002E2A401A|nr:hypothetical protein [Amycolatopsis sp. NBC_01480]